MAKHKSIIAPHVEGYIKFRRRLGFKAEQEVFQLRVFDKYLEEKGGLHLAEITPAFVLELTTAYLQSRSPSTVSGYLAILEDFFDYLIRSSVLTENPFLGRRSIKQLYFSPSIFTDAEIDKILASFASDASASEQWTYFVPRLGRYAILFLMARCGLRISEACRLRVRNVDIDGKTLFVEKTKFYKDRLIPVSDEVLSVIKSYLGARSHVPGCDSSESLFISFYGRSYSRKTIGYFFNRKLRELGLYRAPRIKGHLIFGAPCPHSLRHSFAVGTVRRWSKQGHAIDKIADTLATYMGHANFDYTRLYLKDLSREPLVISMGRRGR